MSYGAVQTTFMEFIDCLGYGLTLKLCNGWEDCYSAHCTNYVSQTALFEHSGHAINE